MLNGIRENIPMSTKCSQEPIFQNHDDRKLATVKHNLESPQNPALNGTTDITGIVCQLVAHKYHFTTYWMKKRDFIVPNMSPQTWEKAKPGSAPQFFQGPQTSRAPRHGSGVWSLASRAGVLASPSTSCDLGQVPYVSVSLFPNL